jgi:hypothetical protein
VLSAANKGMNATQIKKNRGAKTALSALSIPLKTANTYGRRVRVKNTPLLNLTPPP